MGFSYDDYLKAQESTNKPTATPSGGSFSYDDYLNNEKKQKALKADAPKLTKSDLLEDEETFDTIK